MNIANFDDEKNKGSDFLNLLDLDRGIYFILQVVSYWVELLLPLDEDKIPDEVVRFVNDSLLPKTNLQSKYRGRQLTLIEYRRCIYLAFHILMLDLAHSMKLTGITNKNISRRESYSNEVLDARARDLANYIRAFSIPSALEYLEQLVIDWSLSFNTDEMSELVKSWMYRENKSKQELPEDTKTSVHGYIPFLLSLATEG